MVSAVYGFRHCNYNSVVLVVNLVNNCIKSIKSLNKQERISQRLLSPSDGSPNILILI